MKAIGIHWEGDKKIFVGVKKRRNTLSIEFSPSQKEGLLVGGLPTHQVLTRTLLLPVKSKSKAIETLPFQLEALFPVPLDELSVCPLFKKEEGFQVTVHACLKKNIEAYLTREDPDLLTTVPRGLNAFAAAYFPDVRDGVVIHLEEKRTHIVQIGGIVSTSFERGSEDLIGEEGKKRFFTELDRALFFISQFSKSYRIIASGQFVYHRAALRELETRLERGASVFIVEDEKLSTYAIPLGFALEGLAKEAVQLRQGAYRKRSFNKKLWLQASVSVGAPFFLGFIGCALLWGGVNGRKKAFIEGMNTALEESNGSARFLASDSLQNIQLKLEKMKKGFLKSQQTFRFYQKPQRWIDFLIWLRQVEPKLVTGEASIKKIGYTIEKYPTLSAPYVPYQVLVSFQMKTSDPLGLKKKLTDPEGMIDLSLPSAFEESTDGFRATFYLRGH